jgi:hypothetical protein
MNNILFYVLVVTLSAYWLGVLVVLRLFWSGREFEEYGTIANGVVWWAAIPWALCWPLLVVVAIRERQREGRG